MLRSIKKQPPWLVFNAEFLRMTIMGIVLTPVKSLSYWLGEGCVCLVLSKHNRATVLIKQRPVLTNCPFTDQIEKSYVFHEYVSTQVSLALQNRVFNM